MTCLYNTQSQVIGLLDQNATEHAYAYDRLGRLLTDTATVNDAAIDDTIGVLEAVWDVRGLRSRARIRGGIQWRNRQRSTVGVR